MKPGDRVRYHDCLAHRVIEGTVVQIDHIGGPPLTVVDEDGVRFVHTGDDGPLELVETKSESAPSSAADAIATECDALKAMLLEKNAAYGNSVFAPVGIFSKLPVRERLLVRIEDKLSRLRGGSEFPGDDTIKDLIGYLILYRIAERSSP